MSRESLFHRLFIRWSLPLTLGLACLAVVGAVLGSRIQLKLSLTDLLPDKHPAVVKFEKLTEVVGGVGYLAVLLEAADGESHLKAAPQVAEALRQDPLVRSVFYHREERFFVDRMLYYLELKKLEEIDSGIASSITRMKRQIFDIGLFDTEEEKKEPEKPVFDQELKNMAARSAAISPYLISKDNKHLLVMIKPSFDSTDMAKTKQLVATTRALLEKHLPPGVNYAFTERYYNKIVETEMIEGDIYRLGTGSILFIALLLGLYLRSWRALCVIFTPVLMGLCLTMGLAYAVIGHINIITGFLMGIVSGLGVDYGIHLVLRLRLERREPSSSDPDPVWRTIASSGHAVFTGAIAAACAFYLLCFSSFRAFSEFGFICGTGITMVLSCLLVSFSTLSRAFGLVQNEAAQPSPGLSRSRLPVLAPAPVFAASVIATAGLVAASFFVKFEYDFEKMLQHSAEMERLSNLVDDIYGRSAVPSALATDSKEDALAIEAVLKERYIPGTVKQIISGASIVPEQQAEKLAVLERMRERLKTIKDKWIEQSLGIPAAAVRLWADAKPFTFTDLPSHIQDALRGTQQSGYLIYVYPSIKLSEANNVRQYAAMVKDLEARFPNVLTGSDAVIFADILDLIRRDGSLILAVIFLSVGFFIWLNTRDWSPTLWSYLPLVISLPVGMGLMALFGVKFNIFNIAIIPTFVAMGIDVPIHIVHRTKETGSGFKAARDLAPSINLALLTAAVGFGILIFARAGVLKSLGWIALLGTLAIWWVGLFVLPAMLEWSSSRSRARTAPDSDASEPAVP